MPQSVASPALAPVGFDLDVYIVLDDFGSLGRSYRETRRVAVFRMLFTMSGQRICVPDDRVIEVCEDELERHGELERVEAVGVQIVTKLAPPAILSGVYDDLEHYDLEHSYSSSPPGESDSYSNLGRTPCSGACCRQCPALDRGEKGLGFPA